ncbi:MAG: hypothetical protein J5779_00580 [Clostridia bacterium]|nr:hypothetical protein [Clostridia bacterium]
MQKFNRFLIIFVLIFVGFIFASCSNTPAEFNINISSINLLVDERYEIELENIDSKEIASLDFSFSNSEIAYVIPGTSTVVGLKSGTTVLYVSSGEISKNITINVLDKKQKLNSPSGLNLNRQSGKIEWINMPAAFKYNLNIKAEDFETTISTANNYVEISEIENFEILPNKQIFLTVQALPAENEKNVYDTSDWSKQVCYCELPAVSNLAFNTTSSEIAFSYDEDSSVFNGNEVYFYVTISGPKSDLIRILKNETNEYSLIYNFEENGQYTVSVKALLYGRNTSLSKSFNVVKLQNLELSQNETNVVCEAFEENSNACVVAGEETFVDKKIELDGENLINKTLTYYAVAKNSKISGETDVYYLNSNVLSKTVKKLDVVSNFNVSKLTNTSISLEWEKRDGESYLIFENNKTVDLEQKENGQFLRAIKQNISDGENFEYFIVATKQQTENEFYLDSNKTISKQVHKLSTPQIEFNTQTNEINYSILEEDLNSDLLIKINSGLYQIKLTSAAGSFEIKNSYLSAQENSLRINLNKDAENVLYLPSSIQEFTLIKAAQILPTFEKDEEDVGLNFEKIEDINSYKVVLNGSELKTAVSDDIYYTYFEDEDISITIKNLKQSGAYNLKIKGIGNYNRETKTFVLSTEEFVFDFSKLNQTEADVEFDGNVATFGWNEIEGATGYKILIKNLTNNRQYNYQTAQTEYSFNFSNVGAYQILLIAESDQQNVLNSKEQTFEIIKLNRPDGINNLFNNDKCEISFNNVEYATQYKVALIKNNVIIYENIISDNIDYIDVSNFAEEGVYQVKITAISGQSNVINSEDASYSIRKLSKPQNVEIVSVDGIQNLRILANNSINKYIYSIDGENDVEISGNLIDVSLRSLGRHTIKVISKGNGENYLDSDFEEFEFLIKEVLTAPTNLNLSANENNLKLTFVGDENAEDYYLRYSQNGNLVFERTISKNEENEYEIIFARAEFVPGVSLLQVLSNASANNEKYISSANSNLTIVKASEISGLALDSNNQVNLINKQAFIDEAEHTNKMLNLNSCDGGQDVLINVRNIQGLNAIDDYSNGNFYMASEFIEVVVHKLFTPGLVLDGNLLTFNFHDEPVAYKAKIYLEFYGQNDSLQYSRQFDLTNAEISSGINLRTYIANKIKNQNLVGDFKIYVKLEPKTQGQTQLYLPSSKSEDVYYTYVEALSNNLVQTNLTNDGKLTFSISSSEINKMEFLAVEIEKNSLKTTFNLNYLNGISNIVNNLNLQINNSIFSLNKTTNVYNLTLNIFDLFDDGDFKVNFKVVGNDVYYISAQEYISINAKKLDAPVFDYDCDIVGNKLILTDAYLQNNPNVSVYAKCENTTLSFEYENGIYYVYLPYEWEDLSKIKVYATTTVNNFINSNSSNVSFVRASVPTNVHLEENSISGKTTLNWNGVAEKYYVYIYQNGEQTNALTTFEKQLEILDSYLNVGSVTFKVVSAGYSTYLNSNIASLSAKKLNNNISINNTNGVLGWNSQNNEGYEIKEYRIKVSNELFNINSNVHSFDMADLSGYLKISFKIVGKPQNNIISSDYADFYVYKYSAPTSFKVQDGQFNLNEDISENVKYLIKIGSLTFDYNEYINYDESLKENLFSSVQSNSGMAQAKIVVKTNDKLTYNSKQYLALSSDYTNEIPFVMLDIDVENDEFYLTETKETNDLNTYFNYEWVDEGFKDNGKVRLIIRPEFSTNVSLSGWNQTINSNNSIIVYYKDITFNNEIDNGVYQKSYLCEILPKELAVGEYLIEIQKSSIGVNSNLSSKIVEVLNFEKIKSPSVRISQGQMVWTADNDAESYMLNYSGNTIGWRQILTSNFEPDGIFADSSLNQVYSYNLFACGNVTELKPQQTGALEKNYIISSNKFSGSFTKLKDIGDLEIVDGNIKFKNQNNNYYQTGSLKAQLEICFLNTNLNLLTSVVVNAEVLTQTPPDIFFENYLDGPQKNILLNAGRIVVKYRQLAENFNGFINSEYKYLSGSDFNVVINGIAYDYFELLNTPVQIGISETDGLIYSSPTVDLNKMNEINFDVYFIKDNETEIQFLTTTQNNFIQFETLKILLQNNDIETAEIFVVVRGNSYYLSSFKSPTQKVRMINGEIGLVCENGNLSWNIVEDAKEYILERSLNDEYSIYYFTKIGQNYYYKTDLNSTLTKTNYIYENAGQICLNVSLFDIPEGESTFKLKYKPSNSGNVFAIPSVWSNSVRVYKIAMPNVNLEDGVFEWQQTLNNNGYKFIAELENEIILEKDLDVLTYTIDLNELLSEDANLFNHITSYKFKIQAKGKAQSENGIYYINSAPSVFENLGIKQNNVNNIMFGGDVISWDDEYANNKYILQIVEHNENNQNVSIQTVVVNEKSYDLSNAGLSGDSNSSYQVLIKVCGDSNNLASFASVSSQMFKALPTMTDIAIENGYIKFKKQTNATAYVVKLGNDNYTISKVGNRYVVSSLVQTTNSGNINLNTSNEIDVQENGEYIYFWPSYSSLVSGTWLDIKAKGYASDSTIYISSLNKRYADQVSKLNITSASVTKTTYEFGKLKLLLIKLNMKVSCDLTFELYVDGQKINVDYNTILNSENGIAKIEFNNLTLQPGQYNIKICVTPNTAGSNSLKSDVKELSINLK